MSSLYLLIVALLISLMLRGAGVEFRAHHESKRWRAFWDGMIFVGSVLPGLIWGVIAAAALHPSIAALMLPLVGVRFFGVARGVFRYLERLLSHQVTFRLLATLRSSVYEQLEPLLPAYLHIPAHESGEMRRSGDVVQRLVSDIETLQQFYVRVVAPPAVAVLIGGLLWWFLGAFGGTFAFLFLICFLLAGAGIPALSYLLSHRLAQRAVKLRATLQGTLIDGVQGRADLLAFGQEEWYLACVHRQQEELNQVQILMARIGSLQQALRTVSRV